MHQHLNHELDRRFLLGGLAGVAGVSALAAMAKGAGAGGPLNPPAGPVGSTAKPLAEVEPRTPINQTTCPGNVANMFIISQPGSYYLTGNITGEAGRTTILVTAASATIDLMGFAISGGGTAIDATPSAEGVHVHDGVLRSNVGHGVLGSTALAAASLIERVRAVGCGSSGIVVNSGSLVRDCQAVSCGAVGFSVGPFSVAEGCAAVSCANAGFYLGGVGATVRGCMAGANVGPGVLVASQQGVVIGNVLRANGTSSGVNRGGIRVSFGSGTRIEENALFGHPYGIDVTTAGNLVVRNTVVQSSVPFELVAGNRYGPIVSVPAGGTAAVSGATAASTLTTTDPHANFVY